jgi:hypothetical protein
LQDEVKAQETAIHHQEAHIETLKQEMNRPAPTLDPKAIKRAVRSAVGDKIWYCLQTQSQKDFYAAYKHVALNEADGTDVKAADYSEAALRLGFVVEREVIQPCFDDLYTFLQKQGSAELGGVQFGPDRQYKLSLAAPLWAEQWTSLRSNALKNQSRPDDDQLYFTADSQQNLSRGDRTLLTDFLEQWEHPMGQWFRTDPEAVATYLDQISQLRNQAAHAASPLYFWAFELMRDLVVGSQRVPGLFQRIYQ